MTDSMHSQTYFQPLSEWRGRGERFEGASYHDEREKVFVKDGGYLVPVSEGFVLRVLFGAVKLEQVILELRLDAEGTKALHEAFGQSVEIMDSDTPHEKLRFSAQLVLDGDHLQSVAKQTPPGGLPEKRVIGMLEKSPDLLDRLDSWDLRGTRQLMV